MREGGDGDKGRLSSAEAEEKNARSTLTSYLPSHPAPVSQGSGTENGIIVRSIFYVLIYFIHLFQSSGAENGWMDGVADGALLPPCGRARNCTQSPAATM